MARIRNIRPEFYDDVKVNELSICARYLYIGLWTMMDVQGVAPFDARMVKARIFPLDNFQNNECQAWVDELFQKGMVKFFESGGNFYVFAPNFSKHQNNFKDEKPKYPKYIDNTNLIGLGTQVPSGGTPVPSGTTALTLTLTSTLTGNAKQKTPSDESDSTLNGLYQSDILEGPLSTVPDKLKRLWLDEHGEFFVNERLKKAERWILANPKIRDKRKHWSKTFNSFMESKSWDSVKQAKSEKLPQSYTVEELNKMTLEEYKKIDRYATKAPGEIDPKEAEMLARMERMKL